MLNLYSLVRIEQIEIDMLQDLLSKCRERCKQELEALRKHQTERVQLLLQEQEEKEQKMVLENQKRLEVSLQQMKRENKEKEQTLKMENERILALVIQENESQEALMLAKHDGEEREARKAEELQTERNAAAANQPQIPECPVSILSSVPKSPVLSQIFPSRRAFGQNCPSNARIFVILPVFL